MAKRFNIWGLAFRRKRTLEGVASRKRGPCTCCGGYKCQAIHIDSIIEKKTMDTHTMWETDYCICSFHTVNFYSICCPPP